MSSGNNDDNDQHGGSNSDMASSKKECISCEQNIVDNITEDFKSVAILGDTSTCANCGKEGNSDNMNTCNKCKSVKYCNAACKKKHRSKHKKACDRRVAELHDEQLFKEPPPREECPICMLPLPVDAIQMTFQTCCGKTICNGCIYAMCMSEGGGLILCPYCRTPESSSDEEHIKRTKKLMDIGNAEAFNHLAGYYELGRMGLPQDHRKANELLLKSGELGCTEAYYNLGCNYDNGDGVEVDKKKAKQYYELAAMGGDVNARHALGCDEGRDGNVDRAMRHFINVARAGKEEAVKAVKIGFMNGVLTKDEYANTLRAHHEIQKEMKSDERDKAAAIHMMGLWSNG